MPFRVRYLVISGVSLAAAGLLLVASAQPTPTQEPAYNTLTLEEPDAGVPSSPGVEERPWDEARAFSHRGNEFWRSELELQNLRELAKESEDITGLFLAEPETWAEPLRVLEPDPKLFEWEWGCIKALEPQEAPCRYDFDAVVEVSEDGEVGRVSYVEVRYPEDISDNCRAYAECKISGYWMGKEAPLPRGKDVFAFSSGEVFYPPGDDGDRMSSSQLQDSIAEFEESIRDIEEKLKEEPHPWTQQNLRLEKANLERLRFWRAHLEE